MVGSMACIRRPTCSAPRRTAFVRTPSIMRMWSRLASGVRPCWPAATAGRTSENVTPVITPLVTFAPLIVIRCLDLLLLHDADQLILHRPLSENRRVRQPLHLREVLLDSREIDAPRRLEVAHQLRDPQRELTLLPR